MSAVRFFDAIAGRYERSYALKPTETRKRMTRVLSVVRPPPARVLDLGVGTGREVPFLLDAGYAVTGLDASTAMLERCARRARPIPLINADFWNTLPFEDASFGAVIALHGTLAHAPNGSALGRLAIELARVALPGSVWVSEMPSPAWLDEIETGESAHGCSVRRTGPRTCVYVDLVASAAIEVCIPSQEEWRAALEPRWDLELENASDGCAGSQTGSAGESRSALEWRIVARRR
jgi:SAM-dependent methyltransferase